MPPKNCGSCQKLVYPMDELKCLDKTWHKACFRCQVCSMILNMKNYKGYSKMPYCNAHYPQTKHTAVAETPEIRRIAKNTAIQSNIKYHAAFEKAKGQYTAVADDPETLRVRKNMQTISNVAYHGELARKQEMENVRPTEVDADNNVAYDAPKAPPAGRAPPARRAPGSISNYDPTAGNTASPFSSKPQSTTVFTSNNSQNSYGFRKKRIGSITDYDPLNDQYGSIVGQYQASPVEPVKAPVESVKESTPLSAPTRPVSIPDQPASTPEPVFVPVREPSPPPAEPVAPPQPVAPSDPFAGKGQVSKALYDYSAADDDEVGFNEDDIIINCEPIDEGWMTGIVEKSGQQGMLPSNYVEKLNW